MVGIFCRFYHGLFVYNTEAEKLQDQHDIHRIVLMVLTFSLMSEIT